MSTVDINKFIPSPGQVGNAVSQTGQRLGNVSGAIATFREPIRFIDAVTEGGSLMAASAPLTGRFLAVTGAIGGGMLALSGLISTVEEIYKIYKNWKRKEYPSLAARLLVYLPTAMATTALGCALTIERSAILAQATFLAQSAGSAAMILAPIQSMFHLISASHGIYTAEKLGRRLEAYRSHKKQKTQETPVRTNGSFERSKKERNAFLREKFIKTLQRSIQDPEKFAQDTNQECREAVENFFKHSPNHKPKNSEWNELFRTVNIARRRTQLINEIKDLVENSPDEFARQTSQSCLREAKAFFGADESERLSEENQKALLKTVYQENYHAKIRYRIFLAIALLGLIACSAALLASGGAALPLISLLSGLFWIIADSKDLSDKAVDWFWQQNKFDILPKDLQEGETKDKQGRIEFALKTTGAILTAPIWVIPVFAFCQIKSLYERISERLRSIRFTYELTSFSKEDDRFKAENDAGSSAELERARKLFENDRERKLCCVFIKNQEIETPEALEKHIKDEKIEDPKIKHLIFELSTQKGALQINHQLIERDFLKTEKDGELEIVKTEVFRAKQNSPTEITHDFKRKKTILQGNSLTKVVKDGDGNEIEEFHYSTFLEVDWMTLKAQLLVEELDS